MLAALIAVKSLDQRLVVQECLRRLHMQPFIFEDALTLRRQVEHNRVDLLIADLDDTEFLLSLLEMKSTPRFEAVPVIGMSVHSGCILVEELLSDVVDLFAAKPLQHDVLIEGISSVCGLGYRARRRNWISFATTDRGGVRSRSDLNQGMN